MCVLLVVFFFFLSVVVAGFFFFFCDMYRMRMRILAIYLGIELYLFVSHGGMKRQRVHV